MRVIQARPHTIPTSSAVVEICLDHTYTRGAVAESEEATSIEGASVDPAAGR